MTTTFSSAIAARFVIVIAFGAILASVSEFWFYRLPDDVDPSLLLLAYGLLGYLFFVVLDRFRVRSVAALVVAASLLGFLIEGVPVSVVYSNPPLSIIWTSLAWHALITIGMGWLLLRHMLMRGWLQAALFCAAFGIGLGAWNAYMWNALEDEVTGRITFVWQPVEAFLEQFLLGYVLFLIGHIIFDRFYPKSITSGRVEHLVLWAVAGTVSVLVARESGLILMYPIFVGLVGLCLATLWRQARSERSPDSIAVDLTHRTHVPLARFAATLLIPICAALTYWGFVSYQLSVEMNVVMIAIAGPVSAFIFLWGITNLFAR